MYIRFTKKHLILPWYTWSGIFPLGCSVVFTKSLFTIILKQVEVTHLSFLQCCTHKEYVIGSHWQLEAWHRAEFRLSSNCSIFHSTWICTKAILLIVSTSALLTWMLDLSGGQYQLHNLWFQVWQDVNKIIIHHHHCFFIVTLLKEYTFLGILTSEEQFRK